MASSTPNYVSMDPSSLLEEELVHELFVRNLTPLMDMSMEEKVQVLIDQRLAPAVPERMAESDKAKGITRKLAARWLGPFQVKEKVGRVSYMLLDSKGKENGPWHIDQLKRNVT